VTLGKDQIDQDALAAEWGLALEADAASVQQAEAGEGGSEGAEAAASQWQAMVDDGGQFIQSAKGGAERILNQEEIDSLLGFSLADISLNDNSGIRAIIDSAMVSYHPIEGHSQQNRDVTGR
jgi:flagellar motor switch protein FliM